jgi:uncharacterized protein YkwD
MRRTPLAILLFAALIAFPASARAAAPDRLLAPAGACGAQQDAGASVRSQERAMRCMVNHARRSAGLAPLHSRGTHLGRSTDRKAADILACGFSHTACGNPFTKRMSDAGYAKGCFAAGENIAWGSGVLGSPRQVMASWLASAGHRANLLSSRFTDHGIGLRTGALAGVDNAAVWVHQLGRAC